jgi:Family of unknown function (DUF5989)
MLSFLEDLFAFLRERKKYWLIPIVVVFALVGGLVWVSSSTAIAPFVYTFF